MANDCKPNRNMTIIPDDGGMITLTGGQYGHGSGEKYNDPMTKANYLVTGATVGTNSGMYNPNPDEETSDWEPTEIENPEFIELLRQAVQEHTGAKQVAIVPEDGIFIDHQSSGYWMEFVTKSEERQDQYDPQYTYTEVLEKDSWGNHDTKEIKELLKDFIFDSEAYLLSDYG